VIALPAAGLVLIVALGPWTDAAADGNLTVHMAQHLALTMAAAPLLVLGGPALLRAVSRRAGRALVRLAVPVAGWAAFAAVTVVVHLTGFYDYAEAHAWAHALEHALFLGSAVLFWQPVLGRRWRFSVPYLLTAMAVQGAVAAVLLSGGARYEHYPSAGDQHRAAALMWVAGSLVMVAALVRAAWDWLRAEERRALAREAYGR
jgi:putative membrane protein